METRKRAPRIKLEEVRLPVIDHVLLTGHKVSFGRGSGGLRAVSIYYRDKKVADARELHIEEALMDVEVDFLNGGRNYYEVYGPGKLKPRYITGTTETTSELDHMARMDWEFEVWRQGSRVVAKVLGYDHSKGVLAVKKFGRGDTFWRALSNALIAKGVPRYS